jgi:hypothetical protein
VQLLQASALLSTFSLSVSMLKIKTTTSLVLCLCNIIGSIIQHDGSALPPLPWLPVPRRYAFSSLLK